MDVVCKTSGIHGKGVFAARDFKKGETVLKWNLSDVLPKEKVEKLSEKEKRYVCLLGGKYVRMKSPEKYVNHSCDPNTYSKNFCDLAKKDIEKGEEITTDYRKVASGGPNIKCACKSKKCKGEIKS